MAKKRKSENTGLDEVERTLYTSFCTAANSISHLYTQAQHQQKIAFQAGERQSLERIYHWLHREQQAGSNISVAEIVNFLQNELDGEEMTASPGPPFQQQLSLAQQHQHQQHHQQHLHSNNQVPPGAIGYPGLVSTGRVGGGAVDQTKISVFAGALSSPNRRSLPPFPNAQGGYGSVNNGGAAGQHHEEHEESNQEQPYNSSSLSSQTHSVSSGYGYSSLHDQHRESHTFGENDSSMDMHADGGGSGGFYQQ